MFQQRAGDGDDAAGGDGGDGCLQRFGLAFGEPVVTGDADEDAERLADRQVIRKGHQRAFLSGIVASAGWAGTSANRYWRVGKSFQIGGARGELAYTVQMANESQEGRQWLRIADKVHWLTLRLSY